MAVTVDPLLDPQFVKRKFVDSSLVLSGLLLADPTSGSSSRRNSIVCFSAAREWTIAGHIISPG